MDGWNEWDLPDDPDEVVRQMRAVLADPQHSHHTKSEALELLTNMADAGAVEVLRWYREHPDHGMALTAQLALMEADRLMATPTTEPWHEQLLEQVQRHGEGLSNDLGRFPMRAAFRASLAAALRENGWTISEGGQTMLWYEDQLVAFAGLDLIVQGSTLIGFWDREDEERAWERVDKEESDNVFDPLDDFYATLRAANLPWGLLIDISSDTLYLDLIHNLDVDRGIPTLEYLVMLPKGATLALRPTN